MTAIKGSGASLAVATAAGTPTSAITAISLANPCVVTAANALTNGQIVVLTGIVGTTQLNNRAFVVSAVSGSSFTLKGEDSTGYTAWVSGGIGTPQTMTTIANVTNFQGFDGQASEIDVTSLASPAKEFSLGLEDFGQSTFSVFATSGDAGQAKLRAIKSSATLTAFSLTLSDGEVTAFMAFVKQYTLTDVKPDGAVGGNITLRHSNRPAWLA